MRLLRAIAFSSLAALFAYAPSAGASPPDIFGYGPRSQGMGNTGTSFANNYEAVYSNPAGLSRAERIGFAVGLQLGRFDLQINDTRTPLDAYQGLTIGFQIPLPFGGLLEDVLAIGAGFYTPNGSVLQTDILFPDTPSWVSLNRSQSVHLQMGMGINLERLIPGLRLGIGFAALANIGGKLDVRVDAANTFVTETETQLLASFSIIAGAQWDYGPVSLGFTWHDEVRSDIDLNVVTDLPLELPLITITATPQYDPHLFAFEVSVRPTEGLLLAAHLDYRLWSRYPGVVGKTSEFSNLPPAPGFRNTISPSVGVEYTAALRRTRAWIRGGYAFEMTPADVAGMRDRRDSEGNVLIEGGEVQQRALRYLDNNRHVLSLGGAVEWRSPREAHLRLELFTQFHHLAPREHEIGVTDDDMTPMMTDGYIFAGGWSLNVEW